MTAPVTAPVSLAEHLDGQIDPALARLVGVIAGAVRDIRRKIERGARGVLETKNVYGEQQLVLDVFADGCLCDALAESGTACAYASEERAASVALRAGALYSVVADPLDGSSLVDVNLSIGTIVGIHRGAPVEAPGSLVAALYAVYGPMTTLVFAGPGVGPHEYSLAPDGFVLSRRDLRLAASGTLLAPGGLERDWTPEHAALIAHLRAQGSTLRYSGGMVPDVNQIMLKGGGLFTYPATSAAPRGKLRLLFECQPLAYIAEAAGGAASTGRGRLLDVAPEALAVRTPVYLGSATQVALAERFLSGSAPGA